MSAIVSIRRALLSVSDKSGLVEFARGLDELGVVLIASGGTRSAISDAGIPVLEVAEYTGQAEMLGGRVKTLHPKLHGGILARRDVPDDLHAIADAGIEPIDLVVVNLYPFEATVARPDCRFDEAVEQVDIGGPSLIRGAAKNHEGVAVVCDPGQYPAILGEIRDQVGVTAATRKSLAAKAFALTASYDRAVASYFDKAVHPESPGGFPDVFSLSFVLERPLRYGEKPPSGRGVLSRSRLDRSGPRDGAADPRQGGLL